jgi:hypothetical protein
VKTVTYLGPSGYFVARDGVKKTRLMAGTPVEVSDEVADALSRNEGHDFEFDGEVPLDQTTAPIDYGGDPDDSDPSGSTN